MSRERIEEVADALLYEGYLLYPYRADSVKNRQRWTIGGLEPGGSLAAQVLLRGGDGARVEARLRFLHLVTREGAGAPWQEAVKREVVAAGPGSVPFAWPASDERSDGVRRSAARVEGVLEVTVGEVARDVKRVTVTARNTTPRDPAPGREEAALLSLAAAHVLVAVEGGELVSLLEPPDELAALAATCESRGVWPVLVGERGARDAMLASPIIVYDYPEIAPESPGDLFDATEIDEILTLRILTLTDAEKAAMRSVDARARALLERTERLTGDELLRLHGALRAPAADGGPRAGDRVRLRPRGRADIFDMALEGRSATIVSVERDLEGQVHLAVTVDDDPGKDLGADKQVGHRFFFRVDEVERLGEAA